MMKFLLLLFPLSLFSQTEVELVNAKSKSNVHIGKEFVFGCTLEIKEILKENEPILIYGFFNCKNDSAIGFYKAYWKNNICFIKTSDVKISAQDEKNIMSLDSLQQINLHEKLLKRLNAQNEQQQKKTDENLKRYKSKAALNGILIKTSRVFDHSEYTNGTGYEVSFANMSKKTIKYVWFSVKGINAVDDLVSTQTLKCIGPIKPNEEGSYSFDYVWFTDVVEKSKLSAVKIQYMDGSIKQVQNPNDLIIDEAMYNLILGIEED